MTGGAMHRTFTVYCEDPELQAIEVIRLALRDLEHDRQRAVLRYMEARIERDEKVRPALSGYSTQATATYAPGGPVR